MKMTLLALLIGSSFALSGCGTLTGIPGHGGGKRFAIEQEIVSASARAVAKSFDLSPLQGKKVAIYVFSIGDQGSGNIVGGRSGLDLLLRRDYLNNPGTTTNNTYPTVPTTSTTTSGEFSSSTEAVNVLNTPTQSVVDNDGRSSTRSYGVSVHGQGVAQNETLLGNPADQTYLTNVLTQAFFLKGVRLVDPSQAEVNVYVSVDIFGTIRSRSDWLFVNQEKLAAKTAVELMAIESRTGKVLIQPQSASYEAQYVENYILWVGPINKKKSVGKSDGLLVDFSDISTGQAKKTVSNNGVDIPFMPSPAYQSITGDQPEVQKRRRGN